MKIINMKTANVEKYSILLTVIFVSFLNATTVKINMLSLGIAIVEVSLTLYSVLNRKISRFIFLLLLFSCTSIENAYFAFGDSERIFYSFINLPVISSYHIYFMLLLADIRIAKHIKKIFKSKSAVSKISKMFLVLFLTQSFMTILTLIANDNNVSNINGMFRYSVRDFKYFFITMSLVFLIAVQLQRDSEFANKLHEFMIQFLIGIVISALLLVLSGNYYFRQAGTTKQLICSLAMIISSTMILLFFSEKSLSLLLGGMLSIWIQKDYTLGISGTWWLIVTMTALVFLLCIFPTRFNREELFGFLGVLLSVILFLTVVIRMNILNSISNYQISYKLETLTRLLDFGTSGNAWYLGLGDSIQARVEEFVCVIIELFKKPWYLIMGKGFGGTILKHWGVSNWNISGSTFPDLQIANRVYSSLHLGICELFINGGLIGFCTYMSIFIVSLKEILSKKRNPWIFMGMWGILFFYNFTSVCICAAFLTYGYYLIDITPENRIGTNENRTE